MAPRISLALAIHNHQPVGNFGWVLAEVYEQSYLPMLEALERHEGVRVSLHYSGPLLEWIQTERPDFIARLRGLVDRDQVEILGGGYFEPVLASLPERDRIGQLRRMGDELERLFDRRPQGAWLAERVWEPDLPTSLVASGYGWTILDDAHFRAAAIPEEDLWGPYVTEDQGQRLGVFGTEQGLRYRIPFRDVEEVIAYLRDHATEDGSRVGMMGDDGEKFGAWPTTWEHCWGSGRWVDRFFEALEADSDWLSTVTPSDWLSRHHPIGRVYVPTGSYAEMGQWALPANESLVYGDVLHRAQAEHRPEARWLRGASWRNFQVKYREINDLHKQMLRTSEKVAAMEDGPDRDRALDHLYQGQSNDCYWHGLFGGIYISHMRLATYEHLIAAEDLADAACGTSEAAERLDLDLDGFDEVRLATPGQVVTIDLDEGAGIGAWDIRAVRHAVNAVMRRRPEAYHQTLREHEATEGQATGRDDGDGHGEEPASIHDAVRVREPGLAARLHDDDHERRSALVRFLAPTATAVGWADAHEPEQSDAMDRAYELVELAPRRLVARRDATVAADGRVRVTKTVRLGGDRRAPTLAVDLDLENIGEAVVETRLGIEIDDDHARWRWESIRLVGCGWHPFRARRTGPGVGDLGDLAGQRLGRHLDRDDDLRARGRLVGAGRDHLELGRRLRARLPGSRAAAVVAAHARARRSMVGLAPARRDDDPRSSRRMSRPSLVVHGHFYQPARIDPLTGVVPPDPTAAPARDWNARIAAECYRPNAVAGNLGRISWNVGPTLADWMQEGDPVAYQGFVDGDAGANGLAQPYHHTILPLASIADRRTEIRWGLRDFEVRFGRRATGMWLPETAADSDTLRLLADEGVTHTILAPWQLAGDLDPRRPYRVDLGDGRSIVVVIYDAGLVDLGLLRSPRHHRCRLVRPRTSRAAPRRTIRRPRIAAVRRDRDRWRAVRASSGTPGPVPRPPRRPGRPRLRHRQTRGYRARRPSRDPAGDARGADLVELPSRGGAVARAVRLRSRRNMEGAAAGAA